MSEPICRKDDHDQDNNDDNDDNNDDDDDDNDNDDDVVRVLAGQFGLVNWNHLSLVGGARQVVVRIFFKFSLFQKNCVTIEKNFRRFFCRNVTF